MKKINLFLSSIVMILSISNLSIASSDEVIYGEDDRIEVFEADKVLVELSRSTAAMVEKGMIKRVSKKSYEITGETLSSTGICKSERFSDQPSMASCSGFLVGENLLVTAGHCVRNMTDCRNYSWVFDYSIKSKRQNNRISKNTFKDEKGEEKYSMKFKKDSIYNCKKIVEQKLDSSNKNDYALIELDRKVVKREPLEFRDSGEINRGEELFVIGHPSGLPTKIAAGAEVRSRESKFFVSNLDTYGGNSGSAVFNANTNKVEGILVRGDRDYVYDYGEGCAVSNVIGDFSGRGEDVTYIGNIEALMNK